MGRLSSAVYRNISRTVRMGSSVSNWRDAQRDATQSTVLSVVQRPPVAVTNTRTVRVGKVAPEHRTVRVQDSPVPARTLPCTCTLRRPVCAYRCSSAACLPRPHLLYISAVTAQERPAAMLPSKQHLALDAPRCLAPRQDVQQGGLAAAAGAHLGGEEVRVFR